MAFEGYDFFLISNEKNISMAEKWVFKNANVFLQY